MKAAADPTRRAVLKLLAQHGPMRVTDLARHFDISLNAVSKHIKSLEGAGLVSRRTEWREHLIELKTEPLHLIDDWFKDLRSIWALRLETLETLLEETDDMTDIAEDLKLEISHMIPAPRERVFDAWLNPDMLARFMTPAPDVTVPEATVDAREGGRFKVLMRVGDKDMPHEGTYRTIDRPNRLAFTWESPMSPIDGSTVTLDLEEVDGGTQLNLTHVRFMNEEARSNHNKGWTRILQCLADAV
ncbi:MAG: metalloregulator ArsR/SmtB family transcription factor [Pseudomonadota bacterium]